MYFWFMVKFQRVTTENNDETFELFKSSLEETYQNENMRSFPLPHFPPRRFDQGFHLQNPKAQENRI